MGQQRAANARLYGSFVHLVLALTTLVLIVTGARAQTPTAAKSKLPPTPTQTISYISDHYKSGATAPNLALNIRYTAPFLTVTWQAQSVQIGHSSSTPVTHYAQIDLRYANFSVWNTGGADNTIIVDCAEEYFCYRELHKNQKFSHGDLDYGLTTYAARHIARALNYLASLNAANRLKDPFTSSAVVAAGSEPSGTMPGQ